MVSGTKACHHTYPARKYGERDKSMSPHVPCSEGWGAGQEPVTTRTLVGMMGSGTRACHHTYPARNDGERDKSMSPHVPC